MDEQVTARPETGAEEIKTCPRCGGMWPATRGHCLACGMSLAGVPARAAEEAPPAEEIDWGWLDASAPEESQSTTASDTAEGPGGCGSLLARLLGS
jgi:hypothetical protein